MIDRYSTKVSKNYFTVLKYKPFEQWVESSFGSFSDFMGLKTKDKEKIFYKWKHRSIDEQGNLSQEANMQDTIHLLKKGTFADEGINWYRDNLIKFDEKCFEIKKRIGLYKERDEQLQSVLEQFGGMET